MEQRPAYERDARFLAEMLAGDDPQPGCESSAAVPLERLGEYVLLEKVGEGGMGTVYKARHTELDRLVAIKVMRKGRIEEDWALSRFRGEIKAIGGLDHPNIVRAFDARRIGDAHFLVMEYIDGLDLSELADRCGPLPLADACELVRQAALGLQYAHEHGLVHRDIKPSNLMLSRDGQTKILDLGLARRPAGISGAMTVVDQTLGTPDYIAPEQVSDSHGVDIRADIYSLGGTFYKLLTGAAPFCGPGLETAWAKFAAHQAQTPTPVTRFRGDVPPELLAILDRMLAKSPQARFSQPAEVACALERLARGSDLSALLARAEGRPGALRTCDSRAADAVGTRGTAASASAVSRTPGDHRRRFRPRIIFALTATLLLFVGGLIGLGIQQTRERRDDAGSAEKPSHATLADAPATSDWIVLSWTRPRMGKPNLWLFRPDGKHRRKVTNDPRYFDIHPKFSPNGRRIAFIRGESLSAPNDVCVCNVDGSDSRVVVQGRDKSEWFASPVWLSDSRICYARSPSSDRDSDMTLWQVDLDGGQPQLVFRFRDAVGKGNGLVTDVALGRRRLAIVAQQPGFPASADVYVTDLQGKHLEVVWADRPDDWRDSRALWSPDGDRIAWHHNFTRGMLGKPIYHGVGLARREVNGRWTATLQPTPEVFVTPLAWSPRGGHILCARLEDKGQLMPAVTLFLMDVQFRTAQVLFDLDAAPWQPAERDPGRLADWAVLPEDVPIAPLP